MYVSYGVEYMAYKNGKRKRKSAILHNLPNVNIYNEIVKRLSHKEKINSMYIDIVNYYFKSRYTKRKNVKIY